MSFSKIKFILVTALVLGLATTLILDRQARDKLRSDLAALQGQMDDLKAQSAAEKASGSTQAIMDELTRLRGEHSELLRLRGELSRLRSVQAEVAKLQTENTRLRTNQTKPAVVAGPQTQVDEEMEAFKNSGIAKMTYGRGWGIAFVLFAQANGDRMPETFEQAAAYYPKELVADLAGFAPDAFEILYRGTLKEITKPAATIIFREKAPFANLRKPGFSRTYIFADGHAEIKSTPDGNFEQWEKERMMPIQQP